MILRNQKLKELAKERKEHPEKCEYKDLNRLKFTMVVFYKSFLLNLVEKGEEEEGTKHIYITNINKNVNDFIEYTKNNNKDTNSNNQDSSAGNNANTGYYNMYMSKPEDFYRALSHKLRAKAEETYKETHSSTILNALNKYDKATLNDQTHTVETKAKTLTQTEPENPPATGNEFQPVERQESKKGMVKMLKARKPSSSGSKKSKDIEENDYHEDEPDFYD